MRQATSDPDTLSARCSGRLSTPAPRSTTLFWAKKIIHGAMVVPMVAMSSEKNRASPTTCGTKVPARAFPQSGPARNAATT